MYLLCHPNQEYAGNVLSGMNEGFHIGFNCSRCSLQPSVAIIRQNGSTRTSFQQTSRKSGERGSSWAPPSWFDRCSLQPFIPKLHQPGNYRLLLPKQYLCERQISPDLCFLHCTLVEEAVILVLNLGQIVLMAKTDLKSAYHKVPVHPDDQGLLGVCWDDHAWLDMAFPLGLC